MKDEKVPDRSGRCNHLHDCWWKGEGLAYAVMY